MTTFPTSTIQAYTDNLLANLKVRLPKVIITDGPPPLSWQQSNEWMMFGDVNGGQTWASISNQRRPKDEVFTIECIISVVSATLPNDDGVQKTLNDRCIAIFAELEDELRTNPTQDVGPATGISPAGYVIESQVKEPIRLQKRANDKYREAAMVIGIVVKARL